VLVKKLQIEKTVELRRRIKVMDNKLKFYYHNNRLQIIRRIIKPGNSKSLWSAVKSAKDINYRGLPTTMLESGIKIPNKILPDRMASFFDTKIKLNLMEVFLMSTKNLNVKKVTL
jgi:hypothetical protein